MSRYLDTTTTAQVAKTFVQHRRPSPLAVFLWERLSEKVQVELGWEEVPTWECFLVHRKQGLFLSVYVDDIKSGWRKQNLSSMTY